MTGLRVARITLMRGAGAALSHLRLEGLALGTCECQQNRGKRVPRNYSKGACMPFPKQDGRAYTRQSIEVLQPDQLGVYGLYRPDAWIYVGRGDIRSRLLDHLNGDNPRISKERPTGYVSWVTADAERIEKQLIVELDPIANRKVG